MIYSLFSFFKLQSTLKMQPLRTTTLTALTPRHATLHALIIMADYRIPGLELEKSKRTADPRDRSRLRLYDDGNCVVPLSEISTLTRATRLYTAMCCAYLTFVIHSFLPSSTNLTGRLELHSFSSILQSLICAFRF